MLECKVLVTIVQQSELSTLSPPPELEKWFDSSHFGGGSPLF
jgi:hypothetical protein